MNDADVTNLLDVYEAASDDHRAALVNHLSGRELAQSALDRANQIVGEPKRVLVLARLAHRLAITVEAQDVAISALAFIGHAWLELGGYEHSIEAFDAAVEIARSLEHHLATAVCLTRKGKVCALTDVAAGHSCFHEASRIFRSLGDSADPAEFPQCLSWLAYTTGELGDETTGLQYAEQALALRRRAGGLIEILQALEDVARRHLRRAEFHEGITHFQELIELLELSPKRPGNITGQIVWTDAACSALAFVGESWQRLGDLRQAADSFDAALQVARQLDYPSVIAALLARKGAANHLMEPGCTSAMELLGQAHAMFRKLGEVANPAEYASCVEWLARCVAAAEGDAASLPYFGEAIELRRQSADLILTLNSMRSLANALFRCENFPAAVNLYWEILALLPASADSVLEATVRRDLARALFRQGKYTDSIKQSRRSYRLYRDAGNVPEMALTLADTLTCHLEQGRDRVAMKVGEAVLALLDGTPDSLEAITTRSTALSNMGILFRKAGEYDKARISASEALDLARRIKNSNLEAAALVTLGLIDMEAGNYTSALSSLEQGLDLPEMGLTNRVSALIGVAMIRNELGRHAEAMDAAANALKVAEKLERKVFQAEAQYTIGVISFSSGDNAAALGHLQASMNTYHAINNLAGVGHCLVQTGKVLARRGEVTAALSAFEQAINYLETRDLQAGHRADEMPLFFSRWLAPYYHMADLQGRSGNLVAALEYAEKGRARALVQLLKRGSERRGLDLTDFPTMRVRDMKAQISGPSPETGQPGMESLLQPFSTRLTALRDDTAYLEFMIGAECCQLFLVQATDGRQSIQIYRVDIPYAELARLVSDVRGRMMNRNLLGFDGRSRQLYDLLLRPAENILLTKDALCIVPDRCLWELPFHALLRGDDRYVIDDWAVSYAPSLLSLCSLTTEDKGTDDRRADAGVLLLGQTFQRGTNEAGTGLVPLPQVREQLEGIQALYGSARCTLRLDLEIPTCQPDLDLESFRIIHVATHGYVDDEDPLSSYVVTGVTEREAAHGEARISAADVMGLRLQADLAVLCACQTARGQLCAGEGMLGLSWAFLAAGCRSLVVSQWSHPADSAAEIMIYFHSHLQSPLSDGSRSIGTAMRQAISNLKKRKEYSHPCHWAPFIVLGASILAAVGAE